MGDAVELRLDGGVDLWIGVAEAIDGGAARAVGDLRQARRRDAGRVLRGGAGHVVLPDRLWKAGRGAVKPVTALGRSVARHDDLLQAVHQAGQTADDRVAGDQAGIGVGHDLVLVHVAAGQADDLARPGRLEQTLELLHNGRVRLGDRRLEGSVKADDVGHVPRAPLSYGVIAENAR